MKYPGIFMRFLAAVSATKPTTRLSCGRMLTVTMSFGVSLSAGVSWATHEAERFASGESVRRIVVGRPGKIRSDCL